MEKELISRLLLLSNKCLNSYIKNDNTYKYTYILFLNYEVHIAYTNKIQIILLNNIYFQDKYSYIKIEELFDQIDLYLREKIYFVFLDNSCNFIDKFVERYHLNIEYILMINLFNIIKKKVIEKKIQKYKIQYKEINLNFFKNLLLYHENEKKINKLLKLIKV